MNVWALWSKGLLVSALLDLVVRFQGDQSFMMAFAARYAPWLMFNVPRIDYTVEDVRYLLLADQAVR